MLLSGRHRIVDCAVGTRDISDHAAMCLTLHLDDFKETLWRFNTSFLKDDKFHNFVEKEIKDYIYHNNRPDTAPSIIWDASKAVLRGKLIMLASLKEKEKESYILKKI